jgi:hypothetical protein
MPIDEEKIRAIPVMFYFTRSLEHKIFLFFTGVNNEDTNKFGMAGLQNSVPPLINNSCSHGDIS